MIAGASEFASRLPSQERTARILHDRPPIVFAGKYTGKNWDPRAGQCAGYFVRFGIVQRLLGGLRTCRTTYGGNRGDNLTATPDRCFYLSPRLEWGWRSVDRLARLFTETLRRGTSRGFYAALAVQIGSVFGDAVWPVLGLSGAGLLVQLPAVRQIVGAMGGVLLAGLGVRTLHRIGPHPRPRRICHQGALSQESLSLANPQIGRMLDGARQRT
jgi:LysE type translocator